MSPRAPRTPTFSWAGVCARRLARHGLAHPVQAEALADQVGVVCGAHAQIMTAAELSIGLRVAGTTRADVRAALWQTHTLIKTFGPRGTVHLLPARDLAVWISVLAAADRTRVVPPKNIFLTPAQTSDVVAAIAAALADAELTTDELGQAVIAGAGAWAGDLVMPAFNGYWPRWRQAMDAAANQGVLVFGPNRGRNVTYTNPHRWLPDFKPADESTALTTAVKAYLYAYGPAAPQHFAQWLNGPRRWVAALFESLSAEVVPVDVDGEQAWVLAGDTAAPPEPAQGVRLLPYFDAYVVGCHPRERLFPGRRAAERALGHGQAGNFAVVLLDGVVAGIWHQRRSGAKLALTVELFFRPTASQRRQLEQQAARVGEIQEGKVELTLGPVTVGPHA